jgi:glycosyltransferase involved in cell wall biosynthesis
MRIVMLTSSYPLYHGETTAPFIEEIAAALAARGHTIHLVAPHHPQLRRGPIERGVHLHFYRYAPHPTLNVWGYAQSLLGDTNVKWQTLAAVPFALVGSAVGLLAACRRAERAGAPFDVVHAHWAIPNGAPAAAVAQHCGRPLVVSLHGSDVYMAEKHWGVAGAAGAIFRAAAAVTACSGDLHQRGVRLGARPDHSVVIPYGINPHEFRPDPQARHQVRAELRLDDSEPIVLALGRLVYKKGFDVLLDAWPAVLQAHPRARLVLVGYGDLRAALEAQAARLGIAASVHFTGQLERPRAAAYVAAADVFALPIVPQGVDGLPNALLEAMGAGRPIVASHVAGVPDVIEHERHGLLVPTRDAAALAAAINRMLDNNALAARIGAAARQRIERELTWEQTAIRFEEVYARVRRG